jgi:hypothetical protein
VVLTEGVDYDLVYENNINAGTAKITAIAKDNYSGSVSAEFTIKASLKDAQVNIGTQFYTGEAMIPDVQVFCGGNLLTEGQDYKLDVYSDDDYTTGGYVILTPLGNYYSDTRKETFDISFDGSLLEVVNLANEYTYTGYPVRPQFAIKMPNGDTLDYDTEDVVYKDAKGGTDCTNVGTVTVQVPVSISGHKTTVTAEYKIVPKNINACTIGQLENNTYTGKPLKSPVVIVYNGRELTSGTEYTVTYSNNTYPGTADVAVAGIGNFTGTAVLHFAIIAPDMVGLQASPASTSSIKLSWLKNGSATGYQIYSSDGKTLYGTTADTAFTVTGLKSQTEYSFRVRSYVQVGSRITYGEFKTVDSYTQVSGVAVKVTSSSAKTATLTWDKNTTVGGYEIYRSTSQNGTDQKVAVMPNTKTTYTDKSLTSGKTYYYKMRAYKKIGDGYVYGSFSNALSVTVK